MTQFQDARKNSITDEMRMVAESEYQTPEEIRKQIAKGTLIIPANKNHLAKKLRPIGIGRSLRVKINSNIGNSSLASDIQKEIEKMKLSIHLGADTVMDLSTGGNINAIRQAIINESTVPVGTVPIYQAVVEAGGIEKLTPALMLEVIDYQAKQGVDYMTIHCGILKKHLPYIKERVAGIVSRGGALLAQWMCIHNKENFLYDNFDRICAIFKTHDVAFSLGDGMRPGCLADASDKSQFAELKVLGELVKHSWRQGVQVMVEGPGHIPYDQIEMNIKRQIKQCHGAPFYVLGPVVTDIGAGYDHITSAIGGTAAAVAGAAMLCYVTPKEHLGLPDIDDVRHGIIAHKIAAHAADIAKKIPHARDRDDTMSHARVAFDWNKQFELALDGETAQRMKDSCGNKDIRNAEDYCSMCGPDFCAMKVSRKVKEHIS